MTNKFPSDFYITCATVIPVLFLAAAVQGGQAQSLLLAWTKSLGQLPESPNVLSFWKNYTSGSFTLALFMGIFVAGATGECGALYALYRGSEPIDPLDFRRMVFYCTLLLVIAVVAFPFVALASLLRESSTYAREGTSGEAEVTDDQRREPPQGTAGDGDQPGAG